MSPQGRPMEQNVSNHTSRRQMLELGLSLGVFALVGGCQSSRPSTRGLPGSLRTGSEPTTPPTRSRTVYEPRHRNRASATAGVKSRSQWTREDPILARADRMGRISKLTVHHDGMPPVTLSTESQVRDRIALIRRAHVGNGWADLGYHYVVDPLGNVWEGRPISLQGAHVKNYNEGNVGVMVLGNFQEQRPTPQALTALDAFIVTQMRQYRIRLDQVYTHQELRPTACPGRYLQNHMVSERMRGGTIAEA